MKNKVSSIILTITASAVLASVPAVAQLGGALGSTLGGGAQAQGGRGGLGGGLGIDHTLNGTAQGRGPGGVGGGLDLGSDSTLNGATQVTHKKGKGLPVGDATDVTKKKQLPTRADERDRAKFAKAKSYMVRKDDLLMCKNMRCRKRFEIAGVQSVAFLE